MSSLPSSNRFLYYPPLSVTNIQIRYCAVCV